MRSIISLLQRPFDETADRKAYYLGYSALFIILSGLCFFWFILFNKSLIWDWDGWDEYFKAMVYYSGYLKGIIRTLIHEHRLVIPNWDFCIGEGNDIINTLHYFILGDPLALLSVLVPVRFMICSLFIFFFLRLFLAGAVFSELCFETGLTNRYGIVAGSLSYVFCFWALHYGTRYTYFLNPMIYLPLMILGIERIIKGKGGLVYLLSTAATALTSFYFFYVIGILTAVYTTVRLLASYGKDVRKLAKSIATIIFMTLIGISVAGILFLPVMMFFIGDSRFSVSMPFQWLYSSLYYSQLPGTLISGIWRDASLHLGLTSVVILGVFLLLIHWKKNVFTVILLILCCLITLLPIGGRLMNGMSYPTNRWSWAFALLCSYIFAKNWDALLSVSKKEWRILFLCCSVFYFSCFFLYSSRRIEVFSVFPMFFISLIIIKNDIFNLNYNLRQCMLLAMAAIGLINISFWSFSPDGDNMIATFKENDRIWDEWAANDTEAVKRVATESYPRYSGVSLEKNANFVAGISNTQYYWSISNPYMNNFRYSMETRDPAVFDYEGYDDRTTLNALASVQYYAVKTNENKGIPYGYSLINNVDVGKSATASLDDLKTELGVSELSPAQIEKVSSDLDKYYSVYKNEFSLPLGYCYDTCITKEKWDSLDPVQKQQLLLDAAYVDADISELPVYEDNAEDFSASFELSYDNPDITRTEQGFVTTADDMQLTISLPEPMSRCETYLEINGLYFQGTPEYDLYFGDDSVDPQHLYNKTNWDLLSTDRQRSIRRRKLHWEPVIDEINIPISSSAVAGKSIKYIPPGARFSSDRHDYIVNLGYQEDPISDITITFPEKGIYSLSNLNIYYVPLGKTYEDKVKKLQTNVLRDIQIGTDSLSGNVSLDSPKLLCIAIPFSNGWSATVDGKRSDILCVNEHYLGVLLPSGHHSIVVSYRTPYQQPGLIMTLIGIAFLIIACLPFSPIRSVFIKNS